METIVNTLQFDSPKKVFDYLNKCLGDKHTPKKVITEKKEYSVSIVEIVIPNGAKAFVCFMGLHSSKEKQIFCVWAKEPIRIKSLDKIDIDDSKPFVIIKTFNEEVKKSQLEINYKIFEVTSDAFEPFIKVIEVIQASIEYVLNSEKVC